MTIIRTDMRDTIESARRIRFEQTGGIRGTNVQTAIEQATSTPPSINPTPVNAAMSPYAPTPTDSVLYVDTSTGPISIALSDPTLRNGQPLTVKDVSGDAATNNITFTGQSIDEIAPPNFKIESNFGGVRLNPITGGYTVAP